MLWWRSRLTLVGWDWFDQRADHCRHLAHCQFRWPGYHWLQWLRYQLLSTAKLRWSIQWSSWVVVTMDLPLVVYRQRDLQYPSRGWKIMSQGEIARTDRRASNVLIRGYFVDRKSWGCLLRTEKCIITSTWETRSVYKRFHMSRRWVTSHTQMCHPI